MPVTKHITVWNTFTAHRKEAEELKVELASLSGCKHRDVQFQNFKQFKAGHRYLYFTAGSTFGKITTDTQTKTQLARESASTQLAHSLGLPSVRVLVPYQELSTGKAVMIVERLRVSKGSLIREFRDVSNIGNSASQNYAAIATNAIFQCNFRRILPNLPAGHLLRNEEQAWAVTAPHTLTQKISELVSFYEIPALRDVLPVAFAGVDFEQLTQLFKQLPAAINELSSIWGYEAAEYFAHNDTTVKNIYYGNGKTKNEGFFFDYEVASATHYPILSLLQDLTQFYASSSFNVKLQQEFVIQALNISYAHVPVDIGPSRHRLVRSALLLGTLNLGHYILKRSWETHVKNNADIVDSLIHDFDYQLINRLFSSCVTNLSFLDSFSESNIVEDVSAFPDPIAVG